MIRTEAAALFGPELVRIALDRGAPDPGEAGPNEATRERWAAFCRAYAGESLDAAAVAAHAFVDALPADQRLPLVTAVTLGRAPAPSTSKDDGGLH